MEAMNIRIDTRIRIRIKARDGEAIRIVITIRTMDGGIVRITCHYPELMNHPLRRK